MIDWTRTYAALWRGAKKTLTPARALDPMTLDDLVGIDRQKEALVENTRRFLAGRPAHHALLWGARGCGKSSLVKALLNRYAPEGLRVIDVPKEELVHLPEILDAVWEAPGFRFLLFCDDLGFDGSDGSYRGLKSALEGSIEPAPENLRVYATANRRHLLPEFMSDNEGARVVGHELHYGDAAEEKISLSDRFGLQLSFYAGGQEAYLEVVRERLGDEERFLALREEAILFARTKASYNPRTAVQFLATLE